MPFDFNCAMHELMVDVAAVCDELRHVDMSQVAVGFSQARHGRLDGVYATIQPLRFPGGTRTNTTPRGATWQMPRVVVNGREVLYVVTYRLPRFLLLGFEEKLETVVHEMYHISPAFDGTLRLFEGKKRYHTGSKNRYNEVMRQIGLRYLKATSRPELHEFLRLDFAELKAAHGGLVGTKFRGLNPRRIA